MTAHATLLMLVPVAYLLGSVPFGLIVAKSRGVDPRTAGSKNIGATNVGRLLGGKFFAIVFTLDLLKGLLPMLAAGGTLAAYLGRQQNYRAQDYGLWLLVGFAAIFGHMFSIFLKFKGGKGVATSAGVLLGLFPLYTVPGGVSIVIFLILLKTTRYMSIASMGGSASFVFAYLGIGMAMNWLVFPAQWPLLAFAILMPALIIYKHRGNITRLLNGTENRLGSSR
jgi:glycerol-3-phosphate acyltransferase PlsY